MTTSIFSLYVDSAAELPFLLSRRPILRKQVGTTDDN
jgi:hypothetical protein